MRYPIAIETGDSKHAYGIVVPDLPGCFSAGDTLDEALTNAREGILLLLEGLLDAGQSFPTPSSHPTVAQQGQLPRLDLGEDALGISCACGVGRDAETVASFTDFLGW